MASIYRISRPRHFILFAILLAGHVLKAQHVQGGRRPGDSIPVYRHSPPSDSVIQAKLVALALQAPRYEALGHQVNAALSQEDLAKRSWLNLLSISTNFNEFDLSKQESSQYVYPKYFIGLTVPIGLFFTIGPQVKAARENVQATQDSQEELARTLRMEVLSKYATYKNYGALILLQNTSMVDQQAALNQVETKFRDGTATIEQFNLANRSYNDEKVKMLNLQLSQDLVRLDIERMIGVSLDSVTK